VDGYTHDRIRRCKIGTREDLCESEREMGERGKSSSRIQSGSPTGNECRIISVHPGSSVETIEFLDLEDRLR